MGSRSTTFTVNFKGNIEDIMSKVETVKKGVSNIFTASNLGQSLQGDFNYLDKILKRIQNTGSGPIRSDWGAENLIADFKKAGLSIDDMQNKLNNLSISDRKEKFKIFDQDTLNKIKVVDDYTKSIEKQLNGIADKSKEITAKEKSIKDLTALNKTTNGKRLAQSNVVKTAEAEAAANLFTKEEYKNQVTEILKKNKWLTPGGVLSKSGMPAKLDITQGKIGLSSNELLKVEEIIKKASELEGEGGLKLFNQTGLDDLKLDLEKINELKQKYFKSEEKQSIFKKEAAESDRLKTEYNKRADQIKDLRDKLKELKSEKGQIFDTEEFKQFSEIAEKVGVKDVSKLNENSSFDEFKAKIDEVNTAYEKLADQGITDSRKALSELTDEILKNKETTEADIDAQRRLNEQNKNIEAITNRIKAFTGFYGILNLIRRSINSAISTIKELDEQMTKMAVVTSPTISDYWKQLPQYTKRANALGAAIKEVYEADTLYYQQGLKTNQVIAVSNETMKMARIAALDAAEATDRMTSAMRGFNMEINETSAQRVNDVYSQLAAITASDVNEISVAMTKTASIAHSAGMEFETTAAFLSQIIETTRESADTAGTALKTIIARFEELKKSPSAIGEVDGEIIDANKIETALRTVGIALRDTKGQFRDLDDVFLELSSKWDSLDKNTQRYIATIAAGSRQQSRFIAMMQNYAHTVDLVAQANGSAGASQKQFEKTLDSMKTKLNALKNAWDTFTMGILNSDVLKFGVALGTTFVSAFNMMGKAADSLNVILLGSVTRVGMLVAGLRVLGSLGKKAIPLVAKRKSLVTRIGEGTLMPTSADYGKKMSLIQALANRGQVRKDLLGSGLEDTLINRADYDLPKNADKTLSNVGSGLRSILPQLLKISGIVAGIVLAIKLATGLYSHLKYNSEEEAIKRDKEALESYNEQLKKSKDLLTSIKDSRSKYETLQSELADITESTTAWNEKIKENNSLVLELISTYRELALYVERNQTTGQLSISARGWNELEKSQNKKIATETIITQNQERRVNTNALNRTIKEVNEVSRGLGEYLNRQSSEQLQITFADDRQIQSLALSFNTTESEIREAINAIAENKAAIETTEATIQTTNQLLNEQNKEGAPSVEYAQIKGLEARREEEKTNSFYNRLSKGTTYENSAAKEILSFYGIDPDVINGRGDTEILAILKGAVNGVKDIDEAINKYSSDTGFWDFNRTAIAKEISQKFVEARATQRAQNDTRGYESFSTNNPLFRKFIEQGSGALSLKDKKEILNNTNIRKDFEDWMAQNDIKTTLQDAIGYTSDKQKSDTFNKTFAANQGVDSFLELLKESGIGKISKHFSEVNVAKALSDIRDEERVDFETKLQSTEYRERYNKFSKAAEGATSGTELNRIALEAGFTQEEFYQLLRVNEDLGGFSEIAKLVKYFNNIAEEAGKYDLKELTYPEQSVKFLANTSDLSTNLQANLGSIFTNAAIQSGKEAAIGLLDSFNLVYESLSKDPELQKRLANLFTMFDVTDTRDLEKFKKALQDTNGAFGSMEPLILDLAAQIWDLNNAIEKVDFSAMINAMKNLGSLVNEIKNNKWGGTFTEDQKKALLALGADEKKFYEGVGGVIQYSGSEQEIVDIFTNSINTGLKDIELGLREKIYNAQKNGTFQSYESVNSMTENVQIVNAIESALRHLNLTPEELARLQIGENWQGQDRADLLNIYKKLSERGEDYLTVKEETANLENQFMEVMEHFGGFYDKLIHPENRNTNLSALKALTSEIVALGLDQTNKEQFDELKKLQGKQETGERLTTAEQNKMKELAKYFTTRLSYSNAKKGFSEILSTAVQVNEALQDIPINSQEAFDQIDSFMKKTGIQTGNISKENAELYASFVQVLANGGEDAYKAYQGLAEMLLNTNVGIINGLEQVDGAYYEHLKGTLKDAADLLVQWNMAYVENGYLKLLDMDSFLALLDEASGKKNKEKEINPWENPYDWLWNITEQINKMLYQRERLERKYKLAVDDTVKSAEDLYNISQKELNNLQEQARLQSLKGQKATEEAQLLLSHYKEYAKYVSMNPLTGQVQVAYKELDKKGWSQEQGSAFEAFVSRLTELASEIKDSNKNLEDIEDEVKEIQLRGREELINLQNRVKDALVTERQREIDTLQDVNDAISAQQSKLLEAMQEEISETRRIRENTDRQEEIEKKRQRLSYLQRDTSGANQTEILGLQEEIEKDTLSYGDALIDQSLQQMQKDNELAAEKREQQIEIMNTQLARWQESGEIWKSVDDMLTKFFAGDDGSLQNYLQNMENWQALSKLQQEDFDKEFINNGKLAKSFDDGKIATAAEGTLTEVRKYSQDLDEALNGSGVLGKAALDLGKYLDVTLKNFDPKKAADDISGGIGDLKKAVDAINNYLKNIDFINETSDNLASKASSLRMLATAGTETAAQSIKSDYKNAVDNFIASATYNNTELSKEEATKAVVDAVKSNKKLTDILKQEFHTENFELVAENLLRVARYKGFSTGGLTTKTGPAWLDGTPSRPEYVLNAEQTKGFFSLVNGVAALNSDPQSAGGDNYFNVEINVDKIDSDYDVEQVANKVKQIIVDDANYRNVNFVQALI